MRTKAAAGVLILVWLAAGCGAAGAGPKATTASAGASARTSAPPPLSPVASACGSPDAPGKLIIIRTADGVRLSAATAGTGSRGVVLIPELGRAGMCGWWDYAAYLSRSGFRVVIFDHRCTGESGCPAGRAAKALMPDIGAAVSWLRRAGAANVALLGASQGGSEAIIAGAVPPRGVTGVVALSADELTQPLARLPYPRTAMAAAPRLGLPALFAVAVGDPYVSVAATRRLVSEDHSHVKRLVVLPTDAGHGWDLVTVTPSGTGRPALAATVRAFLTRITS